MSNEEKKKDIEWIKEKGAYNPPPKNEVRPEKPTPTPPPKNETPPEKATPPPPKEDE